MRHTRASIAILIILPVVGCRAGRFPDFFSSHGRQPDPVAETVSSTPPDPASSPASAGDDLDENASVLIINGDSITVEDILKPIRKDLKQRTVSMSAERYQSYLSDAIQRRVRLLARDTLIYQEASRNLTDQEREGIDKFADQQIRDRVNSQFAGRQTRYERALAQEGLSIEDERQRLRRNLIITRWFQLTVSPKIADPTRDQLWAVFQGQKASLNRPPSREMQLIEISVLAQLPPEVNAPTDQQLSAARTAARRKALRARAELLAGADFAEVAKSCSTGLHARNGGKWGWVTLGTVRRRWEPAVETLFKLLQCGLPSDVIETPDAFFVVQAAAIDPGKEPDFAFAQPQLVERFRNAQFNELLDRRVRKLQDEAHIRPKNINRFLRAVAQAAPQVQRSASP